jgi:hypothetical protein
VGHDPYWDGTKTPFAAQQQRRNKMLTAERVTILTHHLLNEMELPITA